MWLFAAPPTSARPRIRVDLGLVRPSEARISPETVYARVGEVGCRVAAPISAVCSAPRPDSSCCCSGRQDARHIALTSCKRNGGAGDEQHPEQHKLSAKCSLMARRALLLCWSSFFTVVRTVVDDCCTLFEVRLDCCRRFALRPLRAIRQSSSAFVSPVHSPSVFVRGK